MISAITAVFNRSPQARYGLVSLARQNRPPDEIVVVDDGSRDNLPEVFADLQRGFPAIQWRYIYLDHPEHRISCIPRNVGIRQAQGDIIVFTEPEVLHCGETTRALEMALEKEPCVPVITQIWSMGPLVYRSLKEEELGNPAGLLQHQYAQLTTSPNMQNTRANADWAITGSLNCMAGCMFAVRKDDLLAVGGFDEEFTGHGFDDFDLYARLGLYGRPLHNINELAVIHQWHEKNYPYNIYEHAQKNGARSEARLHAGEYRANIGREWGMLPA